MELHPLVRLEWREDHRLSMRSLIWIEEHADPGDVHPSPPPLRSSVLKACPRRGRAPAVAGAPGRQAPYQGPSSSTPARSA